MKEELISSFFYKYLHMLFNELLHLLESTDKVAENYKELIKTLLTYGFETGNAIYLNLAKDKNGRVDITVNLSHKNFSNLKGIKTSEEITIEIDIIYFVISKNFKKSDFSRRMILTPTEDEKISILEPHYIEKVLKVFASVDPARIANYSFRVPKSLRLKIKKRVEKLKVQALAYLALLNHTDTIEQQELGEI